MPLSLKLQKIPIIFEPLIPLSPQAPPRNLNIRPNILNQLLHPSIIILWPNIPQNHQIHPRVVEIVSKSVHDVNFYATDCVFVEGIVAYRQHAGEDGAWW